MPNGSGVRALAETGDRGVGARIRALRTERGWSARELAERCAAAGMDVISRSAVSKLETGQRKHLKAEEARVLAEIFGVTTDYLLTGESPEPSAGERDLFRSEADWRTLDRGPVSGHAGPGMSEVRRAELDLMLNWLGRGRGSYAMLVLGPPGIGKSVLASQLVREAAMASAGWATILFDIRALEPGERLDVELLVSRMFELEAPAQGESVAANRTLAEGPLSLRIAQRISKADKPVLCVLDSADELTEEVSVQLRIALDDIYDKVRETGNPRARLAFVVASRLDEGWRSVNPRPRVDLLPLPEFGADVIQDKLREAAGPERRSEYSAMKFAELASIVYEVTAGLPPLLEPCLSWIADQEWVGIDRLEEAAVFDDLSSPYIVDVLLAPQSLFPHAVQVPPEQLAVMRTAISFLVRYRFFTRSHLRHHADNDNVLRESLKNLAWQPDDLWVALSRMALLKKPLDEIWQEFYPAVRRLLFRHFYRSPQERASAHWEAKAYLAEWSSQQRDKDRVVGRVEEIWHVASALRIAEAPDLRERLLAVVREAGAGLDVSETYPVDDLSAYAEKRIAGDTEFQAVIGDTGLAVELNHAVRAWTQA